MFNFGFSYIGVFYLLMLFIPNMIWTKNQPAGYSAEGENKILAILERIGEVLCAGIVLIFVDFNIHMTSWIIWLCVSFLFMVLYEIYWIRYFKSEKTLEDFYKPMLGVVVPGATLPVIAFFLLGIYGTNIFMIIASVILGIGHIGVHMGHYKKLNPKKPKLVFRILKGFVFVIFTIIFATISFFIGARNVNYFKHYQLIQKGVDESLFIELGGQMQYILVRGADNDNPAMVFLHGGPSSPEAYANYCWVDDILDEYTVVDWDQRGCGRTYEYNEKIDPKNETATFEQALTDLDELVDYTRERFHQDKVIIAGHSYGTVLGSTYIERHPEKVSQFVSLGQVASMDINNGIIAEEALKNMKEKGESTVSLEAAYKEYLSSPSVKNTIAVRQAAFPHLPSPLPENTIWIALTSPYMGMGDFNWYLKQLQPMDEYLAYNTKLYDSLLAFSLYDIDFSDDIPVHFITGASDYVCPVSAIDDYIIATNVKGTLHVLDGCGHNVQYTKPHEVSAIIKEVLSQNK